MFIKPRKFLIEKRDTFRAHLPHQVKEKRIRLTEQKGRESMSQLCCRNKNVPNERTTPSDGK